MLIKIPELSRIARRFLETLDNQEINSDRDLENRLGQTIQITPQDSISFDSKDHKMPCLPPYIPSKSHIVDYIINGTGIPIEIRINQIAEYSLIIVKTETLLFGYSPMGMYDRFGNFPQSKVLRPAGLALAKQELKNLGELSK